MIRASSTKMMYTPALLVSLPNLEPATVSAATSSQQVAPTTLKGLGLDLSELQAVRKEQIHVLPFLFKGEEPSTPSEF
jgi:hypothetical protein